MHTGLLAKPPLAASGARTIRTERTEGGRWFNHEPEKWEEFRRRYFAELEEAPEAWRPLELAARKADLTLLYAARDAEHNNAVALKAFLQERLRTED